MSVDGSAERTKLVVGLGNPGRRYQQTRHNVGFRVADVLAQRWQCPAARAAFSGLLCQARCPRAGDEQKVLLLKPQTFMNRSGQAVGALAGYYRLPVANVLVVLDDLALPLGQLRARAKGSAGGHQGLADVLAALGTDEVSRLRVGIDAPPPEMAAEDYVLSRFSAEDEAIIAEAVRRAAQAAEDWLFRGIAFVMDAYNSRTTT